MSKPRMRRLRDFVAIFWMLCAVGVVLGRSLFPAYDWLAIHVILLGAVSHSVLVWSEYFAHTLLKSPPTAVDNRYQDVRIVMFVLGALCIFVGYPAKIWPSVVVGASFVAVAAIWHIMHIERKVRAALPGRFLIVVRYYEVSGLMLPIGASFGAILAWGVNDEWRGRLLIAHMACNVLGWVGLTVIGTLVTFWPTVLRTRMHEAGPKWAKQALLPLCAGILVIISGALSGYQLLSMGGLALYLAGMIWWGRSLISPMLSKGIREYAPAAVGFASLWALIALAMMGWALAISSTWADVTQYLPFVGILFAAGFGIQILIGALSYLVPSLIGRGPKTVRAVQNKMNMAASFRFVTPNLALALWISPIGESARSMLIILIVLVYLAFIPIMVSAIVTGVKVRRAVGENQEFFVDPDPGRKRNLLTMSGSMSGRNVPGQKTEVGE
ncbi:uncharacterized membrane protein YqaE (UPF0057 family) [Arcanobacterium pluranimalium]|uniref:hypothetical protein n=1 Tax=Arcanobacterium pluranimalium TaxID=108028 RepID=UPI00195C1B8D|nr:hypothetical protein [Arcanobacterium pluranimalium]MBM7825164.1 uncharacterized membrane protein YqaE (UPF0057 family) [Arcanobacterium pluranimalium]